MNCKTMSGLFDIYVSSILYYSCEVWGLNKGTEVEKLHLEVCKRLLGVKKSTCNIVVLVQSNCGLTSNKLQQNVSQLDMLQEAPKNNILKVH